MQRHSPNPIMLQRPVPTRQPLQPHNDPRSFARMPHSARAVQWQILATTALCGTGATLGLVSVLGEAQYHLAEPPNGLSHAIAALCAGIVLGLLLPRYVIRRRLGRASHRGTDATFSANADGPGLSLQFAASLTGGLIVALALVWVALGAGATLLEEYRFWLARQWLHPAFLKRSFVAVPVYCGLTLVAAVGTMFLSAIHGWYRLITEPNTHVTQLWASLLVGVLTAALIVGGTTSTVITTWAAPMVVFVAAILAVARSTDGTSPRVSPRLTQLPTRAELPCLVAAALTAATVGTALLLAMPRSWIEPRGLASCAAAFSVACLAGMYLARALAKLGLGHGLGLLASVAAAIALLLPYHELLGNASIASCARLAAVSGCFERQHRPAQSPSPTRRRRACNTPCSGLVVRQPSVWESRCSLCPPAHKCAGPPSRHCSSHLSRQLSRAWRCCSTARPCHRSRLRPSPSSASASPWPHRRPATSRRFFPKHRPPDRCRPSCHRVRSHNADGRAPACPAPQGPHRRAASSAAWNVDLGGAFADIILLERVPEPDEPVDADAVLGRRLLRRVTTP